MRAHQRCGLEREWGIVYTEEVLGGDVVLQRPKGYGTGSEEVGARRSLSHSLIARLRDLLTHSLTTRLIPTYGLGDGIFRHFCLTETDYSAILLADGKREGYLPRLGGRDRILEEFQRVSHKKQ